LLAGHFAAAYVNGMQKRGVGSCVKHFAVNSQETRRMTVNAVVDERALREIYLTAFEYAVKYSSPYAVMASYNKINGEYATENKHLLCDVLRNEWGFDGIVISDWGASYNTPKAIEAGMDLEMPEDPSGFHRATVVKAVQKGALKEEFLDTACLRVSNFVEKCLAPKSAQIRYDHLQVCEEVATDSAVLLKNDGILPLQPKSDFCVIGALAETPRYQGAGSSHVNAECNNFLQVVFDNDCVKAPFAQGYKLQSAEVDEKLQNEAVELAKQHEIVLFFGGLTETFEGEGYDRTTLEIPRNQQVLLQKLHDANCKVVFVAFSGAPFEMPWLHNVQGLLQMYLGGQCEMQGAYNLIFGKTSPSGRLAETYPLKLQDTPCFNYFANNKALDEHRESIFVGYRYYNTFDVPVLFPFGFGLSYADFQYSDLVVSRLPKGFEVTFNVKNVSERDAAEVVQLYVDNPQGKILRARRELKEFCKVYLRAGETQSVHFVLTERDFSVFCDGEFRAVNGEYGISVCKNVQETLLSQQVTVDFGADIQRDDTVLLADYFKKPTGSWVISDECFQNLVGKLPTPPKQLSRGQFTLQNTLEEIAPSVGLVRLVLKIAQKKAVKHSPTKSPDDPVEQMISCGARETPLVSLMSVGGLSAKLVLFLLHHSNKRHGK
ncbi:MAG: glycoside hydrolase family 3 C-terminal domain-containing protein, partial [Candidatus Fimimonas sp.]